MDTRQIIGLVVVIALVAFFIYRSIPSIKAFYARTFGKKNSAGKVTDGSANKTL